MKKIFLIIFIIVLIAPKSVFAYEKMIICDEYVNFKIRSSDFDKLTQIKCQKVSNDESLEVVGINSQVYEIIATDEDGKVNFPRNEYEIIFNQKSLTNKDLTNNKVYFFDKKSNQWVGAQTEKKETYLKAKAPINGYYAVFKTPEATTISDRYEEISIFFLIIISITLLISQFYSHKVKV